MGKNLIFPIEISGCKPTVDGKFWELEVARAALASPTSRVFSIFCVKEKNQVYRVYGLQTLVP